MARHASRLPSASIAPLIQEAVQRLNPENGLTQDELVSYVFTHLGFEEEHIQERIEEFLNAGTRNGVLVRTEQDKYQLVETGGRRLRAALDACCTPCRPRCPRRPRCCRPRCCLQRCSVKNRFKHCRRKQDWSQYQYEDQSYDECSQGFEY